MPRRPLWLASKRIVIFLQLLKINLRGFTHGSSKNNSNQVQKNITTKRILYIMPMANRIIHGGMAAAWKLWD